MLRFRLASSLLFVVALLCFGGTASAQESSLVIESPTEGERVETPFTVSGRAPAGAQLELWIGAALEHVFRADSDGRFQAAVNTPVSEDAKLWVHQVGTRGNRLQSAYVVVNWSGEAAPLPPPPETTSADAFERVEGTGGDETSSVTSDAEVEPDADRSPGGTADALPSVDDQQAIDSAPVPPPVDDAAGVDPFETADQVDPFDSADENVEQPSRRTDTPTATASTDDVPRGPPPQQFTRGLAETGVGLAGAFVGAFAGGLLGAGIGFGLTGDGFVAGTLAAIGVIAGWATGLPAGVMITGHAMQGNGKLWATVLGELVGFAVAGSLTEAYYSGPGVSPAPPILFVTLLPAAGAAMGYELTSDRSRFRQEKGLQSLRPTVRRSADGTGAVFGFQLRF